MGIDKSEIINCLVIAISAYYNQMELQIKYQYSNVKYGIDICDLIG